MDAFDNSKVDYEIVPAESNDNTPETAVPSTNLPLPNDPDAIARMGAQLAYLRKIMARNIRDRENKRALKSRVAQRRKKNKAEKQSRKRNRK